MLKLNFKFQHFPLLCFDTIFTKFRQTDRIERKKIEGKKKEREKRKKEIERRKEGRKKSEKRNSINKV